MTRLLAALFLALAPLVVTDAVAQSSYEDMDQDTKKKKKKVAAELEEEVVREVVRGFYLKAGIGSGIFVGRYQNALTAVTVAPLTVGQDFIDNENNSMAWEFSFTQGVYNGTPYANQPSLLPPGSFIQGDTRVFKFLGSLEYSLYPVRRIGIGFRVGAGIGLTPLLMDNDAFQRDVVGQSWGGQQIAVHNQPHPMGLGGLTFEYYTKLSHFSVGADVDVAYILGMDLNILPVGYLKYTF